MQDLFNSGFSEKFMLSRMKQIFWSLVLYLELTNLFGKKFVMIYRSINDNFNIIYGYIFRIYYIKGRKTTIPSLNFGHFSSYTAKVLTDPNEVF